MNEIMNLVTHYNALIIQVIFSVVLLLVVIYIYRAFFVANVSSQIAESSTDLGEVNKKLSQLLQQHKGAVAASSESSESSSSEGSMRTESAGGSEEAEQLKAEIVKLRTQLNESEKKVFEMAPAAVKSEASASSATEAAFRDPAGAAPLIDTAQIEEMTKKIELLQSRLSEYDIIADDIAELSQLRSENVEMKKKLNAQAAPEPIVAVKAEAIEPEPEVVAAVEEVLVDPNVPEIEKNLMSDFEKSTQKGSS